MPDLDISTNTTLRSFILTFIINSTPSMKYLARHVTWTKSRCFKMRLLYLRIVCFPKKCKCLILVSMTRIEKCFKSKVFSFQNIFIYKIYFTFYVINMTTICFSVLLYCRSSFRVANRNLEMLLSNFLPGNNYINARSIFIRFERSIEYL